MDPPVRTQSLAPRCGDCAQLDGRKCGKIGQTTDTYSLNFLCLLFGAGGDIELDVSNMKKQWIYISFLHSRPPRSSDVIPGSDEARRVHDRTGSAKPGFCCLAYEFTLLEILQN
ncbi:Hypothetical protein NTJ_06683 [Nesidiocoris tenuis]|uniref:Uncharacterized protein n=1 Tax=Nesidiocoris tenuis TaxID=355587 RepID=A0ABN7AQY7_9HEMI|nr:Hypothetical protein NTJ_06683 [Nesidiocoris tenuis]